jgi:WD40 repeat protein
VIGERPGSAPPPDSGTVDHDNPWPGLSSFRERDQEFFHGREKESEELRRTVLREGARLTVLYGRSGLGKTSLLQAGLFPRLRRENILPVYIRLDYAGARGLAAQTVDAILAAAAAADPPVEAPPFAAGETLWEPFHRAGANFWNARNQIVIPLLVFDQFEEVFTHGKKRPADRQAFLVELADLVEGRPPAAVKARLDDAPALAAGFTPERHDYRALLALRQDFLADLEGLRGLMRSVGLNRLALRHMDGDAALRAVTSAGGHLIDRDVARQVVRFVAGAGRGGEAEGPQPGGPAGAAVAAAAGAGDLEVDPTLLSVLCRELNNRRLASAAPKITSDLLHGSWKEILANFYERSLYGLPPEVRAFVEDRLLTYSGFRDSVAWDNAVSTPGVTAADLLTLQERRLLRIEERDGKERVELTHDVLTEVIGESRELRRQREARLQAEETVREAAERERQARLREGEARRALRRSRRMVASLGLLLLVVVVLGAIAFELWRTAQRARTLAQQAEHRAERALLDTAGGLLEQGQAAQALAYLAWAMKKPDPLGGLVARSRTFDALLNRDWALPVALVRHAGAVKWTEFSPDGTRLATASSDGTARLWDARTGAPVGQAMRHQGGVGYVHFSADGGLLVTASQDHTARLWDAQSGASAGRPMRHDGAVEWAKFSPNGQRVVTATASAVFLWDRASQDLVGGPIPADFPYPYPEFSPDGRRLVVSAKGGLLVDTQTGKPVPSFLDGKTLLIYALFSGSGRWLAAVGVDDTVRIWDVAAGRVAHSLRHPAAVHSVWFSPDDRRLLTTASDFTAYVWDVATGAMVGKPLRHEAAIVDAEFSPDGRLVLTGSRDRTARLWEASSGRQLLEPLRHDDYVNSVSFGRHGRRVVTASGDGTARVWDVRAGRAHAEELPGEPGVFRAVFDPAGGRLLVTAREAVRLWDLRTGRAVGAPLRRGQVFAASFLADGRAAALTADRAWASIQAWDVQSGQLLSPPLRWGPGGVRQARISADGQRILTAGTRARPGKSPGVSETVRLFETATGRAVADVPAENAAPKLSRDGRWIATVSPAGARVWDGRTGRLVIEVRRAHTTGAWTAAGGRVLLTYGYLLEAWDAATGAPIGKPMHVETFLGEPEVSVDAQRILTTSWDGEVELWDVQTGRRLCVVSAALRPQPLPLTGELPHVVYFSPDGSRFVAPAGESSVRLFDGQTCRPLGAPMTHEHRLQVARFSADGFRLATVSDDGLARVWDVPAGSPADAPALAALAEAIEGFAVGATGSVIPVQDPPAELEKLRRMTSSPRPDEPFAHRFIRWFFADPATRTISPLSQVTVPQAKRLAAPQPAVAKEAPRNPSPQSPR